MIPSRGFPGIAFGEASDGDPRDDPETRRVVSNSLGIPEAWAIVDQVHGSTIATATAPEHLGEADGIITRARMLPIAVATADCVPVVLVGSGSVAIVHAGWRGVAQEVVGRAGRLMRESGDQVLGAVIGPHVGPCCYAVGRDVVAAIGGRNATRQRQVTVAWIPRG